jgi:hypothetical protein
MLGESERRMKLAKWQIERASKKKGGESHDKEENMGAYRSLTCDSRSRIRWAAFSARVTRRSWICCAASAERTYIMIQIWDDLHLFLLSWLAAP